jgi:hypoxanthine phosphoribosyltransferase
MTRYGAFRWYLPNPADKIVAPTTGYVMPADIRCELMSWERFYALARKLALAIHHTSFCPDMIIAIGRGGYMPARVVSDYLDIFDLTEIRIEHYRGVHMQRVARVRYPLAAEITGRRVLLVDDVSDSGDSLTVAMQHLRESGEPAELRTAVLHHKSVSSFTPDFYTEEVREWRWIIYPWAVMEDLRSFLRDMDPPPATIGEFARQLYARHGIEVGQQTLHDVFTMTLD